MTEQPQPDVARAEPLALDLSGLKCPLPALRTRKALKSTPPGGALLVTCTDPMAAIDIPNLIRETGDDLIEERREDDARLVFLIRKSAG
jgi:tRNA 2-thiouridine synthesizing protein A